MFNKKKKAVAEQARQDQLEALRARLDEVSSERQAIDARLATLDNTSNNFDRRLDALDQGVRSMGEQLVTLSSSTTETTKHIQTMDGRLGRVEELGADLAEINRRLGAFETSASSSPPTPPPTPPPPPPPTAADGSGDLEEHGDELRQRFDDLVQQISSIDQRVTSVSMELANQLIELGTEIDGLSRRSQESADVDTSELDARIAERLDTAIDDVLDSTERLAAEQARYQIQFRSDLAELAERIRRPGGS